MGTPKHVVKLQTLRENTESGAYLECLRQRRAGHHICAASPPPIYNQDDFKDPDSKWRPNQTIRKDITLEQIREQPPRAKRLLRTLVASSKQETVWPSEIFLPPLSLSIYLPWFIQSHIPTGSWLTRIKLASDDYFWIRVDSSRLYENFELRRSSAVIVQENVHIKVATRFCEKSKITSISPQYVSKLLPHRILTFSFWRLTGILVVTVTTQTSRSKLSQRSFPFLYPCSCNDALCYWNRKLSRWRFTKTANVATIKHKQKFFFAVSVQRASHNRKAGNLERGNPALQWVSLAPYSSPVALLRHTQDFERKVLALPGSSGPRIDPVVNRDFSYFASSLGLPPAKWTASFY